MPEAKKRPSTSLIGAAGVHYVASELSLRGLIALPTVRNAPGIDLLVTNQTGTWHANIQVKTSGTKVGFWPISSNYMDFKGPHNYYAFLRYLKSEARFEVFLETAQRVASDAKKDVEAAIARGNKPWAPWWPLPRDETNLARVRHQWATFGLGH